MPRFLIVVSLMFAGSAAAQPLSFRDGDLVVLLGGTFIERAQEYGHWEAAIQVANPDKAIHIRNFGWSADTVWAESRGQFDSAAKGYARMIAQVNELKPDVVIFGYGNAEALDNRIKPAAFEQQFRKLISDLPDCRRAFLEPHCPPVIPNASYCDRVASFRGVVQRVAKDLAAPILSSHSVEAPETSDRYFEANGLHLTSTGYAALAGAFATSPVEPSETLRTAIVKKNRLVFYRWRPQNITYLALFRKHEQGNNYAEIPMFDPLIDEADQVIQRLKRQVTQPR